MAASLTVEETRDTVAYRGVCEAGRPILGKPIQ